MESSRRLDLIRWVNRRSKNARVLRQIGTLLYSTAVRANQFFPPPRVLVNGPGKSGTHLLSDCLSLMPKMMFSGRHFSLAGFIVPPDQPWDSQYYASKPHPAIDKQRLERFLKHCPRGMFITAHARFHPVLQEALRDLGFRLVLLLRDPRDVVVSYLYFAVREPWHHHHKHFTEALLSDEERLMATIVGFERCETADRPLAPINERLLGFCKWLDDPTILVCRFENLIGPRGGGDKTRQLAQIKSLGDFVERPIALAQAQQIAGKMYSQGSLTYRKGVIGDWRNHFTQTHRHAFKQLAGELLIELGYEKSNDW